MDEDNQFDSDRTGDEEDLPKGVQDLAQALESSDEEGELEGSSDEDVPDLRAFRLFVPALKRPSEDSQDEEISESDLEWIIAGWYFPTGSAHQGPRVGESYEARIASERLMLQEADLIPCVYCSNVRCSRIRHYSLNTCLSNLQEDKERVQTKTLDKTAGAHIHSVKNCGAFPLPFVDIYGNNIGALNHQMFCTKRSKSELLRVVDEQKCLEVGPYLVKNCLSGSRSVRERTNLASQLRQNEREMSELIRKYKASVDPSSTDLITTEQQSTPHNDQIDHVFGSEEGGIPDLSRNLIE